MTGKSRVQVIKIIIKTIEEKLEEESDQTVKTELLTGIRLKLLDEPPPLEMSESEKQMLALEQQYAALKEKREKEMKEIELKMAEMKKTLPGITSDKAKTSEEIKIVDTINPSLLRREFKIFGQIGEPGQTEKLTFVSLTHQIDSGLRSGYKEKDIADAIRRSISPQSSLRS